MVRHGTLFTQCPVSFELNHLRQRIQPDFRALLAVHEAGHALVYATLFRQPPQELKINAASFTGGYNAFRSLVTESQRNVLDSLCVSLAGRAAEAAVFGEMAVTTGCESDLSAATALAARYVRHWGFGGRLSRTDVCKSRDENLNTDIMASNEAIEALLQAQFVRAKEVVADHIQMFLAIAHTLADKGEISQDAFCQLTGLTRDRQHELTQPIQAEVVEPYARMLDEFGSRHAVRFAA